VVDDVHRFVDQSIGDDQHGDQDVLNNLTEVRSSDCTDQTDRAVPRASRLEFRLEPRLDDRTDRTRACLPRLTRHSKTHGRARLSLEREETEDGHAFSSGRPSKQSHKRPYLYPEHPSGCLDFSRNQNHNKTNKETKGRDKTGSMMMRSGSKVAIVPSPKPREATVMCLIRMTFRLIKAVKPTSKAHSTRCFKCHRIGHYANKCQKQRPLVTLENENVEIEPEKKDTLPIFDDFTYEPMEGLDEEQIRGHQANQEESSSIQNGPNSRTNLFEERGNDVPRFVDQSIGADQHGDQDVLNNLTEVRSSDRTDQTDRVIPRAFRLELRMEPQPVDRTDRTRARLPRPTRHSKTHSRARLSLDREETEDGNAFSSGEPSGQSRKRPYLYPVHPSGSDEPEHYLKGHL
uniref:CCHC-type domain-containing protein n=1 Tax=Brassica oleracea var. oleracea TaxID=109376 RepID=A0A0D3B9D1_BRAOL